MAESLAAYVRQLSGGSASIGWGAVIGIAGLGLAMLMGGVIRCRSQQKKAG